MSQLWLAEGIGTSQPTVSAMEHGERNPGLDPIFRICERLNVSLLELADTVTRYRRT